MHRPDLGTRRQEKKREAKRDVEENGGKRETEEVVQHMDRGQYHMKSDKSGMEEKSRWNNSPGHAGGKTEINKEMCCRHNVFTLWGAIFYENDTQSKICCFCHILLLCFYLRNNSEGVILFEFLDQTFYRLETSPELSECMFI